MKIKELIEELKSYGEDTELDFVIYSGNEDTDEDDTPIEYIGEIDTSLLHDANPRLTIGFEIENKIIEYELHRRRLLEHKIMEDAYEGIY